MSGIPLSMVLSNIIWWQISYSLHDCLCSPSCSNWPTSIFVCENTLSEARVFHFGLFRGWLWNVNTVDYRLYNDDWDKQETLWRHIITYFTKQNAQENLSAVTWIWLFCSVFWTQNPALCIRRIIKLFEGLHTDKFWLS